MAHTDASSNSAIQALYNDSTFVPIDDLTPDMYDLTIIFLAANAIKYRYPTSDPFFSANFYVDLPSLSRQNLSYFSADEYVSAMACADQYQYCNAGSLENSAECTPLTGYQQAFMALNSTRLNLNDLQYSTATRLALSSRSLSTFHSISGRGAAALKAQETIYDRVQQVRLPSTQWKLEIEFWFATALAKLQHSIVEYTAPTLSKSNMPVGTYLQDPLTTADRALCYSQKVSVTASTVSFSVLGLSITIAVGGLIILIYLLLEPVVGFLQRRYGWGEFRRVRWIMDDKFQVQRMMFEEADMGGIWIKTNGGVPVTEGKGHVFSDLHDVDFERPRLGRMSSKGGVSGSTTPTPQMGYASNHGAGFAMANEAPVRSSVVYQKQMYQALQPSQ
jgi:hypothetical protein